MLTRLSPWLPSGLADCSRHAWVAALLVAVLLVVVVRTVGLASTEPSLFDAVNEERLAQAMPKMTEDERLTSIADEYLSRMVERRCLCLFGPADDAGTTLSQRVQRDTGASEAGLAVSWDISDDGAVRAALGRVENQAVLMDRDLIRFGVASTSIPADASWLAPSVGGDGPAIELSGYVLVVIVTAGTGTGR